MTGSPSCLWPGVRLLGISFLDKQATCRRLSFKDPLIFFDRKTIFKISFDLLCAGYSSGMRRSQSISEKIDLFFQELSHKEAEMRQVILRYEQLTWHSHTDESGLSAVFHIFRLVSSLTGRFAEMLSTRS